MTDVATPPPADAPPSGGFLGLMKMSPGLLGLAALTAIASAALSVAPFWCLYRVVQQLLSSTPDAQVIRQSLAWALGLLALRWALMAVSHVLAHRGAFSVQHRVRVAMARRLGEVPMSFFAQRGSGSLRRTLNDDVNAMEGFLAHMLPDAAAAAMVPLAALVLLFAADWRLALASLTPLPVAVAIQWWLMSRSGARMMEWSALQKRIADRVGEYVRGVHVVKAFGLSARSFGELADAIRGAVAWVADYARVSASGWVLFVGLLTANVVVIAPLGAWLLMRGSLDLATWVLFLLVAPVVLAPLLRLTYALGEQMHRVASLQRIEALLHAPALSEPLNPQQPPAPHALAFIGVSHRYGEKPALQRVSFRAEAGRTTALVGASGSGKSTLLRLLPRLYDVQEGAVSVGDVDVRGWSLDVLLAQMSVVLQDVHLFHGTVRDNLLLARPQADEAALVAAAKAARAHDFIMALPQGYDTPLGERGTRLSGGERQRLSIARALLKDAPVLLLDEATSHADAENAGLIREALKAVCAGRTVLMVAHHLDSVVAADHIVVMDGGEVAGQGTHDELIAGCAAYQQLWTDYSAASAWSLGAEGGAA